MLDTNLKLKIDEIFNLEKRVYDLKENLEKDILTRVLDILEWENENIGKHWNVRENGVHYSYDVEYAKEGIYVTSEMSWAYGGYDTEGYFIPYDNLFSDDWKDEAIEKYQRKIKEKMQKEQEEKDAKNRALYEELKKKFENESEE